MSNLVKERKEFEQKLIKEGNIGNRIRNAYRNGEIKYVKDLVCDNSFEGTIINDINEDIELICIYNKKIGLNLLWNVHAIDEYIDDILYYSSDSRGNGCLYTERLTCDLSGSSKPPVEVTYDEIVKTLGTKDFIRHKEKNVLIGNTSEDVEEIYIVARKSNYIYCTKTINTIPREDFRKYGSSGLLARYILDREEYEDSLDMCNVEYGKVYKLHNSEISINNFVNDNYYVFVNIDGYLYRVVHPSANSRYSLYGLKRYFISNKCLNDYYMLKR